MSPSHSDSYRVFQKNSHNEPSIHLLDGVEALITFNRIDSIDYFMSCAGPCVLLIFCLSISCSIDSSLRFIQLSIIK